MCEQVVVEEGTRNVTVVNSFSQQAVAGNLPAQIPFAIFTLLTDGIGETQLHVVIERLDTLDEINRLSTPANFASPLRRARAIFRIANYEFPTVGKYQVLLFADDELLAIQQFSIERRGNA